MTTVPYRYQDGYAPQAQSEGKPPFYTSYHDMTACIDQHQAIPNTSQQYQKILVSRVQCHTKQAPGTLSRTMSAYGAECQTMPAATVQYGEMSRLDSQSQTVRQLLTDPASICSVRSSPRAQYYTSQAPSVWHAAVSIDSGQYQTRPALGVQHPVLPYACMQHRAMSATSTQYCACCQLPWCITRQCQFLVRSSKHRQLLVCGTRN